MTHCDGTLDYLLEADPEELLGQPGSPLGEHLRSCPRCHAAAQHILSDTQRLAGAIAVPASAFPCRLDVGTRGQSRRGRLVIAAGLAAAIYGSALLQRSTRMPDPEPSSRAASVLAAVDGDGPSRRWAGSYPSDNRQSYRDAASSRVYRRVSGRRLAAHVSHAIVAVPVQAAAFATAVPVAPTRFELANDPDGAAPAAARSW